MIDYPPPQNFMQFHIDLPAIFSGIIKFPSDPSKNVPYNELPCTEQDRKNVIEIITTVGSENKLSLLINQSYLKGVGAQIQHIHPLKFLEIGLSTEHYKNCLRLIMDDYFKKSNFMGGLSKNLDRESDKGKLEMYISPFAKTVGISKEMLKPYFQARDWEGLVRFLIQ